MCVIVRIQLHQRVVDITRLCWRPSDELLGKVLKGASCRVDAQKSVLRFFLCCTGDRVVTRVHVTNLVVTMSAREKSYSHQREDSQDSGAWQPLQNRSPTSHSR